MKLIKEFLHLEHTPALDDRISEKSEKLEKHFGDKIDTIRWRCFIKNKRHYAEIDVIGPHFDYHSKASSETLYKTIDKVLNKMLRQLDKKKDKWKNKMHRGTEELVILDPEQAWADRPEEGEVIPEDDFDETA